MQAISQSLLLSPFAVPHALSPMLDFPLIPNPIFFDLSAISYACLACQAGAIVPGSFRHALCAMRYVKFP